VTAYPEGVPRFYSDGGNKLIRVHFDGAIDSIESMHEFSASKAERWAARDGWQPAWRGATSAILQTGDFERVAPDEVPAIQTRMAADAARYT
jgi:hypothetical protein